MVSQCQWRLKEMTAAGMQLSSGENNAR